MNNFYKYPDENECHELIRRYNMFPNIIAHSVQVMRVSLAICDNLIDPHIVDRQLVLAASLLHDIAKTDSIKMREPRHDIKGAEILRELGHDKIAEIVERHVIYSDFDPLSPVNESDIVYYADKRVMHDRVVTINERIDDLVVRYGKTEKIKEMIINNKQFVLELENKIRNSMRTDIDSVLRDL